MGNAGRGSVHVLTPAPIGVFIISMSILHQNEPNETQREQLAQHMARIKGGLRCPVCSGTGFGFRGFYTATSMQPGDPNGNPFAPGGFGHLNVDSGYDWFPVVAYNCGACGYVVQFAWDAVLRTAKNEDGKQGEPFAGPLDGGVKVHGILHLDAK